MELGSISVQLSLVNLPEGKFTRMGVAYRCLGIDIGRPPLSGLTLIWAYWEDTTLDTITDILPMAVSIAVGILGNSLILRNAMKAYEDTTSSVDRKQRSPKALCLAILLMIGMLGMVMSIEFPNAI